MVRKLDDYPDDDDKTIDSVLVAHEILEVVSEDPGLTLSDITERVSVSRSSVHYYLNTLSQIRLLVRERGQWYLGTRLMAYGRVAAQRKQVVDAVEPIVDELARQTGETALLAVEDDGWCLYVYQSFGADTDDPEFAIGHRHRFHCNAFGKVILAFLSNEYRDRVFREQTFPVHTDRTKTSREELMAQIRKTVERSYVYSEGEYREGTASIASPILNQEIDDFYGAIGVVGDADSIADPTELSDERRSRETLTDVVIRMASSARARMEAVRADERIRGP